MTHACWILIAALAAPAPLLAQRPARQGPAHRIPQLVLTTALRDSQVFPADSFGAVYRYDSEAAHVDVYVYPAETWAGTSWQAGDFEQWLATEEAQRRITSYEIVSKEALALQVANHRVEGHEVVATTSRGSESRHTYFAVIALPGEYVKFRSTRAPGAPAFSQRAFVQEWLDAYLAGRPIAAEPAIHAGPEQTCVVMRDGSARCWGSIHNESGALLTVRPPSPLQSIQSGSEHTCMLMQSKELSCTRGGTAPKGSGYSELSVGYFHACALDQQRAAYCWGDGSDGQLGFAVSTSPSAKADAVPPGVVAGSFKWRMISAGYAHTCGVIESGAGYCWGRDSGGELGRNDLAECGRAPGDAKCMSAQPGPVTGPIPFRAISAGLRLSCGVATDGLVFCWGSNARCELGTCKWSSAPIPIRIELPERASRIATGYLFACALTVTGRAYCWGDNSLGQLGNPAADQSTCGRPGRCSPKPVEVVGGHRWARITATEQHACGITLDDEVFCWGAREDGRLGPQPGSEICSVATAEGPHDEPCSSRPVRVLSIRAD